MASISTFMPGIRQGAHLDQGARWPRLAEECLTGRVDAGAVGDVGQEDGHLEDVGWPEAGRGQHPAEVLQDLLRLRDHVVAAHQPPRLVNRRDARDEQQLAKADRVRVVADRFAQFGQQIFLSMHGLTVPLRPMGRSTELAEMHSGGVHVREATVADVAVLAELIALFNGPSVRAERTLERMTMCGGLERALVAEVDGQAAGFACLRIVPALADDHPHATLTELYVRPAWRRRGVGWQLVEFAESRARLAGAEHLVLLTGLDNHAAQAFYRALGFDGWALAMRKPTGP
jgi:ribosomal protein S18 acetylase RimI-like enzyme